MGEQNTMYEIAKLEFGKWDSGHFFCKMGSVAGSNIFKLYDIIEGNLFSIMLRDIVGDPV